MSFIICMNIYENIQHYMHGLDIYDEIFILWHPIFLNLSIHWHLKFRYVCNVSLYYITRSFTFFLLFLKRTRSLTFFIPISRVRYIYVSSRFNIICNSFCIGSTSLLGDRYSDVMSFKFQNEVHQLLSSRLHNCIHIDVPGKQFAKTPSLFSLVSSGFPP